jgi:HPt (histidine-containing phosphotransfer) domain-containing protein
MGIDTKTGLERFSGVESLYLDVVKDCSKSLKSYCDMMSEAIINEDFAIFATYVHTVKSTLATVGAMPLSETAKNLEAASKSGNHQYCLETYPDFHEQLASLQQQLAEIFPDDNSDENSIKEQGDPAFLSENIKIAIAAAEDFEIEPGKEAVGKLLAFDFGEQINAALEKAMAAFDDFDTMEAAKILNGL